MGCFKGFPGIWGIFFFHRRLRDPDGFGQGVTDRGLRRLVRNLFRIGPVQGQPGILFKVSAADGVHDRHLEPGRPLGVIADKLDITGLWIIV